MKIALELKKTLVDQNRLNVSQAELEELLFSLMARRGFGPQYIQAYTTVAAFYQRRQPLVVVLMGAPWTGQRLHGMHGCMHGWMEPSVTESVPD